MTMRRTYCVVEISEIERWKLGLLRSPPLWSMILSTERRHLGGILRSVEAALNVMN